MKTHPECCQCLMRRVLFQARLAGNGTEFAAVRAAVRRYADLMSPEIGSSEIATYVHRDAYDAMGCSDPYDGMKRDAEEVARKYVPRAREFVKKSDDRFAAAVRVSIIGNIMDFGSGIAIDSPEEFSGVFESLLSQGVGSDDTAVLKDVVEKSDTVLYAFDNCGEDLFDVILIRELRRMGKRVVGVVRGAEILNDVAMDDALRVGMDMELDRIVTTGAFAVGFPKDLPDKGLREELGKAGVMIAKGMANFESLTEIEDFPVPIAYLLRAKCQPVADSLGVPLNTNVVRVVRPRRGTGFRHTC